MCAHYAALGTSRAGKIAIVVRRVLVRDLNDRRPRSCLQRCDALLAAGVYADRNPAVPLGKPLDHG